jgi:glycosyltransferase involved in cell wall biosynthesis
MALITIGVPVYNGEAQIAECVECLLGQTFRDIEVLVSDNASTDRTGEILQAIAARDPRLVYRRQPENIGLMGNFRYVLDEARSPYFIWRCHDDLSSPNYVEALYAALQARPGARIAAPSVETHQARRKLRVFPTPTLRPGLDLLNIRTLLFQSHAAWFCGLWDVAALRPVVERVWKEYPSPWGPDHLTLYPFLIDQAVALAPEARFIQRITPKPYNAVDSRSPRAERLLELRAKFWRIAQGFLDERPMAPARRKAIDALTWLYVGKRVYKLRKLGKIMVREAVWRATDGLRARRGA